MSMLTETTPSVAAVSPTAPSSPPIAQVLPLVRLVASVCSWVISLTFRALLGILAPLQLLSPVMLSLVSPITVTLYIVMDAAIFTPLSLLHQTISALYPLYVFFAIACLTGAAVGILGRLIIFTVLGFLAHKGFQQRSRPSLTTSQPLRRRKRRTVRIQ